MAKGKENLLHIGVFGRTNSGKSSLINTLTGQDLAIVSKVAGTTTDPVKKSIEIIGLGNVVIIDTAGIDDQSELGILRIRKTEEMLELIDIAVLVFTGDDFGSYETDLIRQFCKRDVEFIIVANKSDLFTANSVIEQKIKSEFRKNIIQVSSTEKINFDLLINSLIEIRKNLNLIRPSLLSGLVDYGDVVLLVTPIDSEAPDGRMILPQVNAIRDSLDKGCITIVVRESELELFFKMSNLKPSLVVTDSQMFDYVSKVVPNDIMLTGFSVLLARLKGDFEEYLNGTPKISELKDGDRVLLLESCSHTSNCDDIGRVKIPRWMKKFTKKDLEFDVVAGLDKLSRPIEDYALVVQCGGCVITRKQLINRLRNAKSASIPVTNYGMAIAYLHGVYDRAIQPFTK
ncbi:MAG: [FeFe] hydrogenase H-cluster maturation GTPase HydF [Candidatus Kapabacteria bacterium]|nr:[FeFe] hydrogenase H-cluster maturation GTPase HydF [Ignavibacteriota bacterium]MCW5884051.1 [FeFe] hydrogenase H-cluster maturation GTPase HydF [Candidatus Kapabacteria bacterium]